MTGLVIPEVAWEFAFTCGCGVPKCGRVGFHAEALPLVVAAELRRLADQLVATATEWREEDDRTIRSSALGHAVRLLRARADELDGGA